MTQRPLFNARPHPTVARSSLRTGPRLMGMAVLCAVLLQGCNKSGSSSDQPASVPVASTAVVPVTPSAPPAPMPEAAPVAQAYQPLGADALYQMVAPIALFPDRLLAQVLAGATHPDQITAASAWRAQQTGDVATIQNAADQQPWDVSVKALTAFPNVLQQMAQNLPWTNALGEAYANDSTDVMNAIQALRQRASTSGHLKTTPEWKVATVPYTAPADSGEPAVVPPPAQVIEIDPAQDDTVYVPQYDPSEVYGEPLPMYPGYEVVDQGPMYRNPDDPVVAGLIAFGAGIVVASAFDHHNWGWNAWGMNWGDGHHDHGGRPSVVYNNNVYAPTFQGGGGRGATEGQPGRFGGQGGQTPAFATPAARQGENVRPGNEHGMTVPQFRTQDTQPSGGPVALDHQGQPLRPAVQDFQHGHEPAREGPATEGPGRAPGTPPTPGAQREERERGEAATVGREAGDRSVEAQGEPRGEAPRAAPSVPSRAPGASVDHERPVNLPREAVEVQRPSAPVESPREEPHPAPAMNVPAHDEQRQAPAENAPAHEPQRPAPAPAHPSAAPRPAQHDEPHAAGGGGHDDAHGDEPRH